MTQLEAFNTLGICRLSERIREIEALNYIIEHRAEKTPNGARVVRYKLIGSHRKIGFGIEFIPYPHPQLIYNSEVNDPTKWDA